MHAQGGGTDIETAQGCESYQHKYIKEEEKTFMKRKSYQHKYILNLNFRFFLKENFKTFMERKMEMQVGEKSRPEGVDEEKKERSLAP